MDYTTCQLAIARLVTHTEHEQISLGQALSRISTRDLIARIPQPEFNQSLRDGFVLANYEASASEDFHFPVTGMIQAGSMEKLLLAAGEACRIMTGGMIPEGGVQVVQQEDCRYADDILQVSADVLQHKKTFIQHQGSDIGTGDPIVQAGTLLTAEHISLLAAVGIEEIEVYQKPRVGFFCTGSELVDSARDLQPGLKVSSNRYLLEGLIRQHGAEPHYLGTVGDSSEELNAIFKQIEDNTLDLVISTGGMGPGKYDLIEKGFSDAGGETIYNRLNLRPGKDSLFGTLNRTLFFGLPGPPTAVRALMNALVGPALLKMQGVCGSYPQTIQAHLQHAITIKRSGVMQLRGGILSFAHGRCEVRAAARMEPSSCYLIIAPEKSNYKNGTLIDVQLAIAPFAGGLQHL